MLMEIYHRLGDRPSVVHTYQLCRAVMNEVFRLPPSRETEDLYRRLTD
jgi:hypothetical protein